MHVLQKLLRRSIKHSLLSQGIRSELRKGIKDGPIRNRPIKGEDKVKPGVKNFAEEAEV
jgi:hypothetical protein